MNELTEHIQNCLAQVLANIKPRSEAHDWALQLAGLLNQTEHCPKCGGKGWNHKHENCWHGGEESMIRGCHDRRECKKCGGCGRVPKAVILAAAKPAGEAKE